MTVLTTSFDPIKDNFISRPFEVIFTLSSLIGWKILFAVVRYELLEETEIVCVFNLKRVKTRV